MAALGSNYRNSYPLEGLEKSLADICFQPVDIRQKVDFPDYLFPNERHPEAIQIHLNRVQPGYCVATGTERLFFNALLANPKRLFGFIGRDFNPRVKAYNDYVIMLLKISRSCKDFKELSSLSREIKAEIKANKENQESEEIHPEFATKIKHIETRILESGLAKKVKKYYLTHLNDFAEVYYIQGKDGWKSPQEKFFRYVHYHNNDQQWKQLRRYAIRGNLIATIGDIGDLAFLDQHKISVIDVSNIPSYSLIHFQGKTIPHVIWTRSQNLKTMYLMGNYTPLSDSERGELDALVAALQGSGDLDSGDMGLVVGSLIRSKRNKENASTDEFLHCYSQQTLQWLRDYASSISRDVPKGL